ncbi:MAG: hypothetical protein LAP38_14015 [Acidobacteriia bacterium]|nr:hypothetical protein [Terriglobia bacterium]
MISIRKAATELERWEEFSRAAVTGYSAAIDSTGQHAVDLDKTRLDEFRRQLLALKRSLRDAATADQLRDVQGVFDGELRDYQRWARDSIEQLRRDIAAATAALEAFSGSIAETGTDLEADVTRELAQLNRVSASDDISEIRGGIRASTAKIAASVEEMHSRNQVAIAQLKDEIRVLHQQIDASKRAQTAEPGEETGQRDQISGRLEELIRQDRLCSVLLVVVRNLEGLRNCHAADVIETGLQGFATRFESILPDAVVIGRWSRDQFAAVLGREPSSAMALSSEVMQQLSRPVVVEQAQGAARSVIFDARAGVVEFRPGSDPSRFQSKLKQLADALAR